MCSNVYLQRHIRIHTGDQPYKCDVCGKGFSVNCYLQKHMRRYTGDTPYKCDICGNGFSRNGSVLMCICKLELSLNPLPHISHL
jgi:KRAB domain-containing zinc finger protein